MILVARAGTIPLLDPDESRFARTSVEMLRERELVVPLFEGEPRLAKPPLLHWLQIFFFSWAGAREWAARLPSALATLGSIALAGWIARRRFGGPAGIWTAAIVGTMPLVMAAGRLGTTDALLSVHVLAILALELAAPAERTGVVAWLWGALLGLAFLAKGPVGIVLPLLLALAGRTAAGRELVPSVTDALRAAGAAVLVVLPWGLALVDRVGWDRVIEVLRREAVEPYFAGGTHAESPLFYLRVLPVALFPWIGALVVAVVRLVRLGARASPTARYAAAALVAGIVFLSLGRNKLPTYLLPLAPLAAIVATWELSQELAAPRRRSFLGLIALAVMQALAALACALAASRPYGEAAERLGFAGLVLFGGSALACGLAAVVRRPRAAWGATAGASAAFLLLAALTLHPALGEIRSAGPLLQAVPALDQARDVVTVDMQVPSLTFYRGEPAEDVPMARLLERIGEPDEPLYVFDVDDLELAPDAALVRLIEVGGRGKYRVFREDGRALTPLAGRE